MMKRRVFGSLVIAATFVFAGSAHASSLKIHGSTTVFANLFADHQAKVEADSGQVLTVVANGSSRGVNDVATGAADMGMISAPLPATIAKLASSQSGFVGDDLVGYDIGSAKVAFIVHPSNPVKELSTDQIAGIMQGEITNWADLGGQPMPIKVIMEQTGGGVRTMAEKSLLDGGVISVAGTEVPNGPQIVKIVEQMPMAFGIAAAAVAKGSPVAVLGGHDAPAQPLILVTKGDATAAQLAVIDSARNILN